MARSKKPLPPVHVVRQWSSSPVLYGVNSADQRPNPDFHPIIGLTHKGTFVDEAGKTLDLSKVPDYIKREAKGTDLRIEARPIVQRELSMADAMLDAGVEDSDPDPAVRRSRARRASRVAA